MIVCFLFFNLLILCVTLIDFWVITIPCIHGINSICLLCMILLIYCWIRTASIYLSLFLKEVWPAFKKNYFTWKKFFWLVILFNCFYFSVIRWYSYLSWSWSGIFLWEHPYAVCVCRVCSRRTESEVSIAHAFSQCTGSYRLDNPIKDWSPGDGKARDFPKCEIGPFLCLIAITTLLTAESRPKLLKRKSWISGLRGFHSLSACIFPS